MRFFLSWRFFVGMIALWVIFLSGNYLAHHYAIKHIHYHSHKQQVLKKSWEYIEKSFTVLEKDALKVAQNLKNNTLLVHELSRIKRKTKLNIFKLLLDFSKSSHTDKNIVIYDHKKNYLAWRDRLIRVQEKDINRALKGETFSSITHSTKKVYVNLSTFVPLFHPKEKHCVGVIVVFTPLDSSYPQYVKQVSFAEKMLAKTSLQKVEILFSAKKKTVTDKPLFNLKKEILGWVNLVSKPLDIISLSLKQQKQHLDEVATGILLLLAVVFFIYKILLAPWRRLTKCIIATLFIWTTRYLLVLLNFPKQLVSDTFSQSDTFHSLLLGEFSGSLIDLLFTASAFFLTLFFWAKVLPSFRFSNKYSKLTKTVCFVLFPFLFAKSFLFLCYINHSIIQNASFEFFSLEFFPSLQIASIYVTIILFGLTFALANELLIKNFLYIFSQKKFFSFFICFAVFFLPCCFFSLSLHLNFYVLVLAIFAFWLAPILLAMELPQRNSIRRLLVLVLVCIALYPVIHLEVKQKKRSLVLDKSEEYKETFIPDVLDAGLNSFATNEKALKYLRQKKENAAFLLWADNPSLAEYVDNIEIRVYRRISRIDPFSQSSFIWANHPENFYEHLSVFTKNFYPRVWHNTTLVGKLNPNKHQLLKYIPGHTELAEEKEKSALFFVGGTPILDEKEQQIGFVVILSQYKKLAQTISMGGIFSNRPRFTSPLLQAYFYKKVLIDSNVPYLAKNFSPSSQFLKKVQEEKQLQEKKHIWVTEEIDDQLYDCVYFPYTIREQVHRFISKDRLESRKCVGLLGYPLASNMLLAFYFLQFFFIGVALLLFPILFGQAILHLPQFTKNWSFSFEHKLILSFFLVSIVPVIIMGLLSKESAVEQVFKNYRDNLVVYLKRAEKTLREKSMFPLTPYGETEEMPKEADCRLWGEQNQRILNIYLPHQLHATNRWEFFHTELMPLELSGTVYYNLFLLRRDIYIHMDSFGDHTFIVGFKALTSALDHQQIVGAISIPMVYSQVEVHRKETEIISTVFTIYTLLLLIVFSVGMLLAHQITRPLRKLMEGTRQVSLGELEIKIPQSSNDEIGQLIDSFNRMTKDLKISRDKLVQAEKDAAWREMARQIAHEIKNPLTPMKLSAQHILRAHKDEAKGFGKILEKSIATIVSSIDSLSKTASSFSEFSRFIKPNLAQHDVKKAILECLDLFEQYQEEQNIQFNVEIAEHLPKVFMDFDQMKRVIINLLTNAVQAMDNGGNISITCFYEEENSKVVIKIKDDGCGIPKSIKTRLFEPNISTKPQGSGLGLAISKRAINQMGGTINIESDEQKGTVASIDLFL